jgi:hypothetical protein
VFHSGIQRLLRVCSFLSCKTQIQKMQTEWKGLGSETLSEFLRSRGETARQELAKLATICGGMKRAMTTSVETTKEKKQNIRVIL